MSLRAFLGNPGYSTRFGKPSTRHSREQRELAAIEKDLRKSEQDLVVEQEKIKRSEKASSRYQEPEGVQCSLKRSQTRQEGCWRDRGRNLGIHDRDRKPQEGPGEKETDYQALENSLVTKKTEAEAITNHANEALVDLVAQKERIAESIEREFLKKYEMVKKARGTGIAELENGTCRGCHMALPPQLNIRVLKTGGIHHLSELQSDTLCQAGEYPVYNKIES